MGGCHSFRKECNCCSCRAHRGEYKGKNNPNYGNGEKIRGNNNPNFKHGNDCEDVIHYCIESNCKQKVSESNRRCRSHSKQGERSNRFIDGRSNKIYYCIICGKEITFGCGFYGSGMCSSCSHKERLKDPQNHPNYIDGRSFEDYPQEFNQELKELIRKRNNYTCRNCNMTEEEHLIVYGCNLHIHHIDYNKKNNNENNLISLCLSCNSRANYNRKSWEEFFEKKLKIPTITSTETAWFTLEDID